MGDTMKNTFKKLGLIIATVGFIFTGVASVYAKEGVAHFPSTLDAASYQRFLDIETGD
jgi:hypothetical protein